jgi:small-conductance mechanosensitive channel
MDPQSQIILVSIILFFVTLALPKIFPRWPKWAQVLLRFIAFAMLTTLLVQTVGSPFRPKFHPADSSLTFWERIIEAFWWILAARSAIGLARLLIVFEHRPRESQIVTDLIAGAIYVAASLAIIDFAFQVQIAGLLATSGIIAIVLGLALQSTLSDVFSGIAVGIERPYRVGDLLWVEGGVEGHVLQVNWRSTHISTFNGDVAVVPNSIIAKSRLVNHIFPVCIDAVRSK